jgi:hypothetical protein
MGGKQTSTSADAFVSAGDVAVRAAAATQGGGSTGTLVGAG